METKLLLILIPTLPLVASILTALLGPRVLRDKSHVPTVVAIGLSFILSLLLVYQVGVKQAAAEGGFEEVYRLWTWANVADAQLLASETPVDFSIDVTLRADALTAIMLAMVTFVSSLVAIYSVGYMHGDRGYWRFFSYISLFVFSMTMLVSVSNFLLLYVFWEAVGVCSYLLIGFWYEKPEASEAGKKAFLVNRVGDFGFALALFLIWTTYGTLNFHSPSSARPLVGATKTAEASPTDVSGEIAGVLSPERIKADDYIGWPGAGDDGERLALAICLLLMLGACGKSAQFPLHVWLPDAMEGPSPVSALIHAATMVTAGVYMVVRCTPLFMVSPTAQLVVACIGAGTALLAALIALTQYDLKRVLAYSTISQLGYMFLALGTGTLAGISAGMFHLFTHAFFKALLFLAAGSVMHAMGNVIDMRRFGGLRKIMPITFITFLIGSLALAGFPLLSGFFSKDAVVASVHDKVHALEHQDQAGSNAAEHDSPRDESSAQRELPPEIRHRNAQVYQILYYVAIFTAWLTAFYTFRALFMTFFGDERLPDEAHGHAHESPWNMCGPLVVLAICAVAAGLAFDYSYLPHADDAALVGKHSFAAYLIHAPSLAAGDVTHTAAPGEFHWNVAAVSVAAALLGIGVAWHFYLRKPQSGESLKRLLDQPWYFSSPRQWSTRKFYFDEIYRTLAVWPLRVIAGISAWWDNWVIDGLVNLIGRAPASLGAVLRLLQIGLVPFYALAMVLGVLILLASRMYLG